MGTSSQCVVQRIELRKKNTKFIQYFTFVTLNTQMSLCSLKSRYQCLMSSPQSYYTYQKRIRTMAACNATHSGHWWHRWRNWTGSQIDYSLTIGSRTSNPLRRTLTNQQTITWTTYVLLSWWRISNWLELEKEKFEHFLSTEKLNRIFCLIIRTVASLHWLHLTTCCSRFQVMSIIDWHTRHVTIGTPPPCELCVV